MDLRRTSAPLTQTDKLAVVSVADVKSYARITSTDEDALIADEIETSYDFFSGEKGWLGRCCLLEETFELFVPAGAKIGRGYDYPRIGLGPLGGVAAGFSRRDGGASGLGFEIPMRPFTADASLLAFDVLQGDGSYQAMSPSLFNIVQSDDAFARIERSASGFPWPYFGYYAPKAYRFQFKAGFGTTGASIPAAIRRAIIIHAGLLRTFRTTDLSLKQRSVIGVSSRQYDTSGVPITTIEKAIRAVVRNYRVPLGDESEV